MPTKPITLFTFGYYGWGNHTPNLIKAVDAVEKSRGFKPPIFVDIRIRRSVRAAGFTGTAFEKLLGEKRHRWMKLLGNKRIVSKKGPMVQIAKPEAVDELLALAIKSNAHDQRIIFFCSCQWPKLDGDLACHRTTVAGYVRKAAKDRGESVEIVEWPGGEPAHVELDLEPTVFKSIVNGKWTIPLGSKPKLNVFAGLPWCSIATLRSDGETIHRLVGPAKSQKGAWVLPIQPDSIDATSGIKKYEKEADSVRRSFGLEPIIS